MASAQVGIISILLLVSTVLVHYEALRLASGVAERSSRPSRSGILSVIAILFAAHFLEIGLYASVLSLCQYFQLGALAGQIEGGIMDWLYFSLSSYTTLGIGDVHPRGPLRLIAGIEALNGLVLIGWSASFTYLTMEQTWALPGAGKAHSS